MHNSRIFNVLLLPCTRCKLTVLEPPLAAPNSTVSKADIAVVRFHARNIATAHPPRFLSRNSNAFEVRLEVAFAYRVHGTCYWARGCIIPLDVRLHVRARHFAHAIESVSFFLLPKCSSYNLLMMDGHHIHLVKSSRACRALAHPIADAIIHAFIAE